MIYQNFIIQLYFYCSVILVPIGSILNILSLIVFLRKRFNQTNYGYISSFIAFFNIVALIWNYVFYKYFKLIGIDLSIYSNLTCYFFRYFGRISQQFPIYIQVFLTFVKYFEISYPTNRKTFLLKKKVYINLIILGIIISILIFNIPNSFKYLKKEKHINRYNQSELIQTCIINRVNELISNITSSLVRTIIPFIFITIFNILMIRKLIESKQRLCSKAKFNREIQFSFGLCLINSSFVILNFPLASTYILTSILYKIQNSPDDPENKIYFLHLVFNAISYSYHGLLFIFNYFFNISFRNEFFKLIRSKSKIKMFKSNIGRTNSRKKFNN